MLLFIWQQEHTIPTLSSLQLPTSQEYIGGLSDFTGELGRIAVMLAAQRQLSAVKETLEIDYMIADFISKLNVTNRYGKKLDAVYMNAKKLEDVVYELTLLQRSGRKNRVVSADLEGPNAPSTSSSNAVNMEE
jgi:predicted translin family RNA/ssDNA-binding protein